MRPITKEDLYGRTTIRENPGPGAHDFSQELNPEGRYSCSKFNSSKSKVWNPKSSQRFYKSSTDAPGAGAYQPINDLSAGGKYVLSKYKGDGKRKFAVSFRDSFVNLPAKQTKSKKYLTQLLALVSTVCPLTLDSTIKFITKLVAVSTNLKPDTFLSTYNITNFNHHYGITMSWLVQKKNNETNN